jgi:uncharacterized protein YmfQ (DUF2313 family)
MNKFWQALASLLPSGFAWPRDPNSTLMRVMRALAFSFNELHEFTRLTAFQWQPHQTVTRLAEWEECTGLPDACFGLNQDDSTRRKLLLSRLRGPVLTYTDSSPASPGALIAICAWMGYVASVAYNTPFRCGVSRVGQRLGALDGNLYVTVTLQSTYFRVGASRVGDRLLQGQLNGGELVCYLKRVVPARYQINVIFV